MKKLPKISDSEWEVMKVLWDKSPLTSSEIIEKLKPVTKWSPTTIYTLINRLVKKEAIKIEEGSSPYICYPIISKEDYTKKEYKSFLSKVYNGSLNLMISNIVEEQNLSDEEIDELKKILDKSKEMR
ncbi:BlaI/MecI/CopY family transcriptional regulator [Clostridium aciditolerans]|uniref:BlaI/MecI/CopY family transcriptional regulator n=2 Tax=Clostridium aciditolerans TaxID=339861 RepID=A0A934I5F3_9CLOT|nr:BlaI/MecI/CopY family transcriptional regulator [Clostridium aciditolerans]MBI6875306.1 BlaI/MecI/CopY family transcriptional regulator [Clostridium aciditolerans]